MKQTIKHFVLHPARLLAGVCCLLTIFALAAGFAQQAAPAQGGKTMVAASTTPAASPAAKTGLAATPAARPATAQKPDGEQGIKVHGHWKIEVKNLDGTLARTVEFDNALVTPGGGDTALAGFLTGQYMPGDWMIDFDDLSAAMCTGVCRIIQVANQGPLGILYNGSMGANPIFQGLHVTSMPATATTGASIVLQGSATANVATTINYVSTNIGSCQLPTLNPTTLPTGMQSCATVTQGSALGNILNIGTPSANINVLIFTQQTLSSGVPVVAGQIIQFTVTISFS